MMLLIPIRITAKMINPYVDERRIHFGFSLGINLMSYHITDTQDTINGEVYHARVSSLMPGFSVGFITDVRLSRHLNLRLCPALHFGQKSIKYKNESGNPIRGADDSFKNKAELISLPISIPLYLKWSAERHNNFRPYLIGGGGVSFDFGGQKERPVYQRKFDYFVEVGFGCDFYTQWFKFCPEIKYHIGFANMLTPIEERNNVPVQNEFYTRAIKRLTNQMITLTFNFE